MTSQTGPGGTSYFTYNGLGLRTGKTDSTGIYAYVCDGTTPASPVLADGLAVYTPGLSASYLCRPALDSLCAGGYTLFSLSQVQGE